MSFRDGSGIDGFIEVAALSQLHPSIEVMIGVYLLALRHPLPVARQLATMSTAPCNSRARLGVPCASWWYEGRVRTFMHSGAQHMAPCACERMPEGHGAEQRTSPEEVLFSRAQVVCLMR